VALLVALILPVSGKADGSLDTTLGCGGISLAPYGDWDAAAAAVTQPDGKIVTAGETQASGRDMIISTRMTASGALDPSYGHGGFVIVDIGGAAGANAITLAPDGKIVIAGVGTENGRFSFVAVRLTRSGKLDPSFGSRGIAPVTIGEGAIANAVAIQRDGRIVLAGTVHSGYNMFAAARLNSDGSIDGSFGSGGSTVLPPPAGAWGMALQPDGRIVLGGQTNAPFTSNTLGNLLQTLSGIQSYMAARLLPTGKVDRSFGKYGILTIPIGSQAIGDAVALQPDGKIILAGSAVTSTTVAATARLTVSGSLDRSFGAGGIAMFPEFNGINAVTLAPRGKIVLAGVDVTAIRLGSNGRADPTFGTGGVVTDARVQGDAANGVTIQPDGKIVLAGVALRAGRPVLSVVRLNAEGPPPATGVERISHRWRRRGGVRSRRVRTSPPGHRSSCG
jgi:uncharacterized delta-60 repeat protein